jgi:hypothetical protein
MATDYAMDDREVGVRVPIGSRIFISPYHADWLQGLPILLSNEHPGVKGMGREAGHSPPTSAEVKKTAGPIHPLPHTCSRRSA